MIGRVYRRADLHAEFGGQRQSGIVTPRLHPLIFIFTGSGGQSYGYQDVWDDDGILHYFGQGQIGDMRFLSGNAAIRDHAENEEEIHLFEEVDGGVRYVNEVVCSGYEWTAAPDKTGAERQAIVFQLVRADGIPTEDVAVHTADATLEELAVAADADPTEEGGAKEGLRKVYRRSEALKLFVRKRAAGKCEGCGEDAPFISKKGTVYLEAHHTNRLSDSGPGNRKTVIALCPNCHSRVHFGKDGDAYNSHLKSRLKSLEPIA